MGGGKSKEGSVRGKLGEKGENSHEREGVPE